VALTNTANDKIVAIITAMHVLCSLNAGNDSSLHGEVDVVAARESKRLGLTELPMIIACW
jgi:hypothetical protein